MIARLPLVCIVALQFGGVAACGTGEQNAALFGGSDEGGPPEFTAVYEDIPPEPRVPERCEIGRTGVYDEETLQDVVDLGCEALGGELMISGEQRYPIASLGDTRAFWGTISAFGGRGGWLTTASGFEQLEIGSGSIDLEGLNPLDGRLSFARMKWWGDTDVTRSDYVAELHLSRRIIPATGSTRGKNRVNVASMPELRTLTMCAHGCEAIDLRLSRLPQLRTLEVGPVLQVGPLVLEGLGAVESLAPLDSVIEVHSSVRFVDLRLVRRCEIERWLQQRRDWGTLFVEESEITIENVSELPCDEI